MSSRRQNSEAERARVRIPADVEREDKLLGQLTARQLAMLAASGVIVWAVYAATRAFIPLVAFGIFAVPFATVVFTVALGRFEGVSADRWLRAAWRHHRAPHRLVPAPDGVSAAPALIANSVGPLPEPLRLPVAGVDVNGIIDLGHDGLAMVCRASAVTFSLRTPPEQEGLVSGFARWLNSLSESVQIVVRAESFDLTPSIDALLETAPNLPHPALEVAARSHAAFLVELAQRSELLRREVFVVLRQSAGDDAAGRLSRRATEATVSLAAAGVTLLVLDGAAAMATVTRALDPAGIHRPLGAGGISEPITLHAALKKESPQ